VNIIFGKLSFKDKIFNGALLVNAAIFVAIYTYRMFFRDFGERYAKITCNPFEMSFAPFLKEPILILMMIIACIRAYSILLKKDRRHVFTDSLLFAGIGYLIAIMMLRFTDPYYFFPSVLLFIPAFAIFLLNRNGSCRDLNETSISLKSKRCNIICSCFAAMCMIITVMKSSDAMQKCWESRNNDHLFFEHIATESKAGKTVYVIFNDSGINRGRETLSSPHIAFLRYYCQKFHIVTDVDPLKISENSIVLFYSISPFKEQSQAFIIKKLEKNGFKIIRTLGDLKLYGKKV
jgi:hypothetical protein